MFFLFGSEIQTQTFKNFCTQPENVLKTSHCGSRQSSDNFVWRESSVREVCKNKKVKKSGPGTTSPLTPPSPNIKWSPYCVFWKRFLWFTKEGNLNYKYEWLDDKFFMMILCQTNISTIINNTSHFYWKTK